jgi:hypothetical protein
MFKKIALAAVAATTAMTAFPAAAEAQGRGYYDGGRYERSYRDGYYNDRYQRGDRYYRGGQRYRGNDRYYSSRSRNRCSGTTGTIIGAIAGGLLGDAVVGRRGDETAGALIGGAAGALAGRAIDKGDCRRR